jgi:hypothetical protein
MAWLCVCAWLDVTTCLDRSQNVSHHSKLVIEEDFAPSIRAVAVVFTFSAYVCGHASLRPHNGCNIGARTKVQADDTKLSPEDACSV